MSPFSIPLPIGVRDPFLRDRPGLLAPRTRPVQRRLWAGGDRRGRAIGGVRSEERLGTARAGGGQNHQTVPSRFKRFTKKTFLNRLNRNGMDPV